MGGCGIYETRPGECRYFSCLWLNGFEGNDSRPDKSGIMLDVAPGVAGVGRGITLVLWEARRGALQEEFALSLTRRTLLEGGQVIVTGTDKFPSMSMNLSGHVTHAFQDGKIVFYVPKDKPLSEVDDADLRRQGVEIVVGWEAQ